MPAVSTAQRRLFAIAEHDPSALYPQNRKLASLSHQQLHDFAATKEKKLPHYIETKQAKRERKRDAFYGE